MASCSRDPTAAQVHKARLQVQPVIAFLNSHYLAAGQPLPEDQKELSRAYTEKTQVAYPMELIYVAERSQGPERYKLYLYVQMRTSLWYVSKTDPHDDTAQGWWLDYDDGTPWVQVADP
ncbi:MAG: hypothetical protein JWO08_4221 [Verrucomicrobiaceae bacterium]|nr:hypothetical protein [Verrucomicrobiaceae bacterium]